MKGLPAQNIGLGSIRLSRRYNLYQYKLVYHPPPVWSARYNTIDRADVETKNKRSNKAMLTTSSNFQFLLTQTHQVNGESLSFEWLESQFFTAIGKGLQLKLEFETEFIAKAPTCIQSHPTPQLAISFQSHQWRNLDLSSITLSSESKNLSLLNIVILGTFMTKFWRALVLVNLCLGPHEVYLQKVSLHSLPEHCEKKSAPCDAGQPWVAIPAQNDVSPRTILSKRSSSFTEQTTQ